MKSSGTKRRNSCVDEEVCANLMRSKRQKLKNTLDTAGVVRDTAFTRRYPPEHAFGVD
jgi:hypothetical protein